jgi:hypothetical protein
MKRTKFCDAVMSSQSSQEFRLRACSEDSEASAPSGSTSHSRSTSNSILADSSLRANQCSESDVARFCRFACWQNFPGNEAGSPPPQAERERTRSGARNTWHATIRPDQGVGSGWGPGSPSRRSSNIREHCQAKLGKTSPPLNGRREGAAMKSRSQSTRKHARRLRVSMGAKAPRGGGLAGSIILVPCKAARPGKREGEGGQISTAF